MGGLAAVLFTLAGKLVLDSTEFVRSIGQAKGQFSGLGSSMDATISKVKRGLAALTGGLAIGKLLKMGLSFNQQIQNYSTNFGVLLQNEQKGIEMTERLKDMAAKTPFGITDLAGATQSLLAYGVEGEKVEGVLSNIGDIALGDKNKLQSIATVFGQISMAGKLLTQDYKQLLGQGFNPLTYISKRTGESLAELQDRMSKGGITIEEVTQAFKDATSEGGQFYQGMEKASETTSGLMSTLSDNWTEFIGNFTQPINDQLSEKVLPATISALGRISDALFGAEEASKKTKAELYGTDENGNQIDPNANLSTWYENLIKTWTDGLPETDAIVNDYVTSFNTETDRIKKAMQDRLLDTANPLTEEQKAQFEAGITNIDTMQARIKELLASWAGKNWTDIPEEEKQEMLDMMQAMVDANNLLQGDGTASTGQTPIERIMDKLGDFAVTGIEKAEGLIVGLIDHWNVWSKVIGGIIILLSGTKGLLAVMKLVTAFTTGTFNPAILALAGSIAILIDLISAYADAYKNEFVEEKRQAYRDQKELRGTRDPLTQGIAEIATRTEANADLLEVGAVTLTDRWVRRIVELFGGEWDEADHDPARRIKQRDEDIANGIGFAGWYRQFAENLGIINPNYENTGKTSPHFGGEFAASEWPTIESRIDQDISDAFTNNGMLSISDYIAATTQGIENATVDVTVNIDGMALRRSQNQLGRRFNYAYGGGSGSRPSAMRE